MPAPHVLIEHENTRTADRLVQAFAEAGFSAETCPGPRRNELRTCPLVDGDACPQVGRADVVVNALPLGDVRVFIAQRARARETPVLLALSKPERLRVPVLDYLATVIPRTATPERVVEFVRQTLDTPTRA